MLGIFFCTFPSTIISLAPICICICSKLHLYLQLWTSSRGSDAFGEKIENKALCALSCIPSVYTVQWAIQCALCMYFSLSVSFFAHLDSTLGDTVSDHCTLYCPALCIVCFLVFLQRTLGNAVQCCVVSIWILCAILVLLAALIWRQILLVVFVFRKKASRISGNVHTS